MQPIDLDVKGPELLSRTSRILSSFFFSKREKRKRRKKNTSEEELEVNYFRKGHAATISIPGHNLASSTQRQCLFDLLDRCIALLLKGKVHGPGSILLFSFLKGKEDRWSRTKHSFFY
jgi:hypothetical protein